MTLSCTSPDGEASGCSEDHRWHAGMGMQSQCQAQGLVSLAEERGASGPHGGKGSGNVQRLSRIIRLCWSCKAQYKRHMFKCCLCQYSSAVRWMECNISEHRRDRYSQKCLTLKKACITVLHWIHFARYGSNSQACLARTHQMLVCAWN